MTDKSKDKSKKKEETPKEETEQKPDPLAEAQAKADEYLDMARRVQADFDNYRRRTQKDNEEFRAFATAGLINELLTIVDDFDRALSVADGSEDFINGVKGIRSNLMKLLESKGVKEIDASGKFDPNFHEALCAVEADEAGMVAEVFQKGYLLNGKVLRFAKVKVTKKKAVPEKSEKADE